MFKFVSAVCLGRSIGAQWKVIDISNVLVYEIFNDFTQVFLTLSNIYLDGPIYVDMDTLREEFSSYGKTLNELLVDLGNRSLETVDSLPNSNVKYIKYSDAFYSGYKVDTTIIGVGSPENYRPLERVDLKITRPNFDTDMKLLHSHCLISVNGYYHLTDCDANAAYVYNGAISKNLSNNNHVGITSFLDIGKLTKVPILAENIYSQAADSKLYERTYLRINQDITNKTVLLVIGGYLYFPQDGVFWQAGERSFAINWSAIPLIDRYYESKKYLDLSSLGLSVNTFNDDIVNAQELMSDDVLIKYMTMSQSFFVVVDTPNIFSNKIPLRVNGMPGMFTAYKDPTYPLIVGYGKLAEYWKTYEDSQWSVTVQDSFMKNYVFDEKPINQLNNVTGNANPYDVFRHSPGFLLQIGSYS